MESMTSSTGNITAAAFRMLPSDGTTAQTAAAYRMLSE
jgi:hypothetical protein